MPYFGGVVFARSTRSGRGAVFFNQTHNHTMEKSHVMNRRTQVAVPACTLAVLATGLLVGCATTIQNPAVEPKGERDNAIYEAGKVRTERKEEKKYSVDVFVDPGAIDLKRTGMTEEELEKHLLSSLDGYMRSKLQKFPFFNVTTADGVVARMRARKMANAVESGEEPEVSKREEANYVILAKFASVMTHGDGGVANASTVAGTTAGVGGVGSIAGAHTQTGNVSMTGLGVGTTMLAGGAAVAALGNGLEPNVVDIVMSFEFYDNVHEKTISSESIVRKYSGSSKDNTAALVLCAARECADEYITILARDYLQEARVLDTTGNGKYAWVTLGRKDGVAAGTKVMFYEFVDADDVMAGWSKLRRPVAYGTVVGEPDDQTCWVEVEKASKVHVKKYHFVKIQNVEKKTSSILERIGL